MANRPPSARQIAYLRYLGHTAPESLANEHDIHQAFFELDSDARRDDWFFDRLHLYPELYRRDVLILGDILTDYFKRWMTDNCPRPRAIITPNRCRIILKGLSTDDPDWWKQSNRRDRFRAAFMSIFPPKIKGLPQREPTKYFVGRNGENLGEMQIAEIKAAVAAGELGIQDFYFHTAAHEWRPLSDLLRYAYP